MNNATPEVQTVSHDLSFINEKIALLKQLISEDGFVFTSDYVEWRDRYGFTDEVILPMLQDAGYGFINTAVVSPLPEREVIVDLRYMAAVMLLIYSYPEPELDHGVLECVKSFYRRGSWKGAGWIDDKLIEDTYAAYSHHFTCAATVHIADLSEKGCSDTSSRLHTDIVARNISALNELVKDDEELTAVFQLCVGVMYIVNTSQCGRMRSPYKGNGNAYSYFWRAACKIRDRR